MNCPKHISASAVYRESWTYRSKSLHCLLRAAAAVASAVEARGAKRAGVFGGVFEFLLALVPLAIPRGPLLEQWAHRKAPALAGARARAGRRRRHHCCGRGRSTDKASSAKSNPASGTSPAEAHAAAADASAAGQTARSASTAHRGGDQPLQSAAHSLHSASSATRTQSPRGSPNNWSRARARGSLRANRSARADARAITAPARRASRVTRRERESPLVAISPLLATWRPAGRSGCRVPARSRRPPLRSAPTTSYLPSNFSRPPRRVRGGLAGSGLRGRARRLFNPSSPLTEFTV